MYFYSLKRFSWLRQNKNSTQDWIFVLQMMAKLLKMPKVLLPHSHKILFIRLNSHVHLEEFYFYDFLLSLFLCKTLSSSSPLFFLFFSLLFMFISFATFEGVIEKNSISFTFLFVDILEKAKKKRRKIEIYITYFAILPYWKK